MRTAVVIPHRGVNAHRDSNLACATRRWNDFGLEVFTADSDGPMFSRSQATNRAAAKTDADVLIVADNDVLLDKPEQVIRAAELASETGMYVVAFSKLRVLDWNETLAVHEGADPLEQPVLETVKLIWGSVRQGRRDRRTVHRLRPPGRRVPELLLDARWEGPCVRPCVSFAPRNTRSFSRPYA